MCALTRENTKTYEIWTVNQANQKDWPKETWKKYPIQVIQTTTRVWLGNSESACVSIHRSCPLFLLINTLFGLLLSFFVWILFSKAEGTGPLSLTTCLVVKIRCSLRLNPASISVLEPKLHSNLLQAEVTRDHIHKCEVTENDQVQRNKKLILKER